MTDTEPEVMRSKIGCWAKKGSKIKRGSPTSNNNSVKKKRHFTGVLAANALALGWLNGNRRRQK